MRELLGWDLEGKTYDVRMMLADVNLDDARNDLPWPRFGTLGKGVVVALRLDAARWRILGTIARGESEAHAISPESLKAKVERLFGPGPFRSDWSSTFNLHCRTSPHFRRGRVLLAGDAAHINSPIGGMGMNGGIQDAGNLAWKLARALRGGDEEALLSSYEDERRPAIRSMAARSRSRTSRLEPANSGIASR